MARQTINHPVSMVSLLVIAWQRLSYTNVKTLVAQFSFTGNYRQDHQNGEVATRVLNPEDMGALERAEGGEPRAWPGWV